MLTKLVLLHIKLLSLSHLMTVLSFTTILNFRGVLNLFQGVCIKRANPAHLHEN
jgi:hypothetical protein